MLVVACVVVVVAVAVVAAALVAVVAAFGTALCTTCTRKPALVRPQFASSAIRAGCDEDQESLSLSL